MTLDVSGGEFATAMQRLQFVAREAAILPFHNCTIPKSVEDAAANVLLLMRYAQARGWPLGARIVEILRAACGSSQG